MGKETPSEVLKPICDVIDVQHLHAPSAINRHLQQPAKTKKGKSKWVCNLTRIWVQGYAPPNADRREAALARKRQEYLDCIPQYYDILDADRSEDENVMLHQVNSLNFDMI